VRVIISHLPSYRLVCEATIPTASILDLWAVLVPAVTASLNTTTLRTPRFTGEGKDDFSVRGRGQSHGARLLQTLPRGQGQGLQTVSQHPIPYHFPSVLC